MVWRVTNEVDENEWIVIWSAWCEGKEKISVEGGVSLASFQSLLLARKTTLETLDFHVGLCVNEMNRKLISSPSRGSVGVVDGGWVREA